MAYRIYDLDKQEYLPYSFENLRTLRLRVLAGDFDHLDVSGMIIESSEMEKSAPLEGFINALLRDREGK